MPRSRSSWRDAAVALAALLAPLLAACGDDAPTGPAAELAEQVAAAVAAGAEDVRVRLETLGVTVERAELEGLEGGDLRCPPVEQPSPGDRATCEVALRPADVLVDVEFDADGSVSVVGIEVQALRGGSPEVEDAVGALVADRVGDDLGPVAASCPGVDDLVAGTSVRCRVTVGDGGALPLDFTVDGDGALVLETALLARAEVESFLAGELEGPAEGAVEVDCGDEPVLAGPVEGTLRCEAVRAADGEAFEVRVRIESLDGELAYDVVAG